MITISSNNSLVRWEQNENRTGIHNQDGKNISLILKPTYYKFFNLLAEDLKDPNHQYASFVDCWMKHCKELMNDVRAVVENIIDDFGIVYPETADDPNTLTRERVINRVCNKVRGNLAEILVEKLANEGYLRSFCKNGTYKPVDDPHHEEYSDGSCLHPNTKLIVEIQIKNYAKGHKVGREVFDKCSATFHKHICGAKADITTPEQMEKYIKTVHQIIFTFTDPEELLLKEKIGMVNVFGPEDIDDLNIQGDDRGNEAIYSIFEEIAEEIDQLI